MTVVALIVSAFVVGAVEAFWRSRGHHPSVADSESLWGWHRERICRERGGLGVVLIGSSRILTGFSTDAFRVRYPRVPIAQLGIPECSPLEILDDLAADGRFRGIVICELADAAFLDTVRRKYGHQEYIDHSHRRTNRGEVLNLHCEAAVQQLFCIRTPQLALDQILYRGIERGSLPDPFPWTMQFDRRQKADYRGADAAQLRALTLGKMHHWFQQNVNAVPTPRDWLQSAMRTQEGVRRIQDRGGLVVFVRFPSTDETWELENRHFPKEEYWDRFAEKTSGVAIHFRDVPTLAKTECPDTSHIDYRDADGFTNRLMDEIQRRRIREILIRP
ncbi:MAG: hypothetical protein AB7O26_20435 [Planctomycetaceae bacterium]